MKVIRESYRAGESWPFFVTLERGEEIRGYFRVNYDALLELADELDKDADNIISAARDARFTGGRPRMGEAEHDAYEWRCIARRIREALGVEHG